VVKKAVQDNSFNLTDLAREDLSAPVGGDDQKHVMSRLGDISKLLAEQREKQVELDELAKKMVVLQDRVNLISSTAVPDIFLELGLTKVKLADGSSVEVKTDYAAGITEEKKPGCFAWLEKFGHASLITREFSTKFKKGDERLVKKFITNLTKLGVTYKDKSGIHPQTLKAFVKEQLAGPTAKDFPREQFSVFEIKKTVVSK
jgi:hypothetical protein